MENEEGETNSVGCNELWLRSWNIISPEENNSSQDQENEKQPAITPSYVVITEEIDSTSPKPLFAFEPPIIIPTSPKS